MSGMERRPFLKGVASGGLLTSLAGCSGSGGGQDGSDGGGSGGQVDSGSQGGSGSQETQTLSITTAAPWGEDNFTNSRFLFSPWIDKLNEKLDNYTVEYDFQGEGAVGGSGELFDLAAEGVVDFANDLPAAQGGRMPLNGVINLPAMWPTGEEESVAAALAYHDMATPGGSNDLLYDEYEALGVRPIMAQTPPPYQLVTNDQPIENLSQLEGLVLRAGGGTKADIANALGMAPAEVAAGDIYSAHQQGTVNADILSPTLVVTSGLEEVMNFVTTNLNMGGFSFAWVMGQDTFDSYPEEVRTAMVEAGDEVVEEYIREFAQARETEVYESDAVSQELPIDEDSQINLYETPAREEITNALAPVVDSWIEEREANDRPGQEVVDEFQSLQEELVS